MYASRLFFFFNFLIRLYQRRLLLVRKNIFKVVTTPFDNHYGQDAEQEIVPCFIQQLQSVAINKKKKFVYFKDYGFGACLKDLMISLAKEINLNKIHFVSLTQGLKLENRNERCFQNFSLQPAVKLYVRKGSTTQLTLLILFEQNVAILGLALFLSW